MKVERERERGGCWDLLVYHCTVFDGVPFNCVYSLQTVLPV